jgi:tetratricopeptide (TPR) repeat protein
MSEKMKVDKREKDGKLSTILNDFFDAKTVLKINKILPEQKKSKKSPRISTKTIELIGSDVFNSFRTDSPIDFIITKADALLSEDKLIKLLSRLGDYSIDSGEYTPAVYIFEKLVGITKAERKPNKITANSLLSLGDIFSRQALWGISFNYINEAYKIYNDLNDTKGCADCENLLGSIYGELGNLNNAQAHFEKALSYLEKKKEKSLKGKIEINLGIINNIQGNFDSALKYYNSALDKFTSAKDSKRVAEIRHNLGMLHSKTHKYNQAMNEFDQSIHISAKTKQLPTLGISYLGKAIIYAIQEDYKLSDVFAEKALQVCHKINDRLSIADVYKVKGIIHRDTKNYKLAENYLNTSLRINKELKNEMNAAETEFELGLLHKHMGNKYESRAFFERAKKYFIKIGALKEAKEIDKLVKQV